MNERFESELERYERDLIPRVGALRAADARREMAAHLEADHAARIEVGIDENDATRQALESLGCLKRAVRAEIPDSDRVAAAALVVAPGLLASEWFLVQAWPAVPRGLGLGLALLMLLIVGIRPSRARRPWIWTLAGGGTVAIATTLGIAVAHHFDRTGSLSLPTLRYGTWWEIGLVAPMFGLPVVVLYRVVSALADRSRATFDARWARRA